MACLLGAFLTQRATTMMKKCFLALTFVAACIASAPASTTITNFTTGFFSPPDWVSAGDPLWAGQQGWTGTGDGDSVSVISGYSAPGGASGTLGLFEPLSTPSLVQRDFTPMDTGSYSNITVSFVAEFSILELDDPNFYNDTFVFDLRSSSSDLVLSFAMQAPSGPGFDYTMTSVDSRGSITQWDLNYDAVYRIVIEMEGTDWTGALYGVNDPSGSRDIVFLGDFDGGSMLLDAAEFSRLDAGWHLASGDPGELGTIALVVNEFTVTSTGIPEPSTWALLLTGLGAVAILGINKARRRTPTA